MFWFDNSEEVMQLFIWHKDSDAWIPVAPPTTLEGRVSQGEDTQKAIIAQINESLQVQADILLKVGELDIQKGSVARYKVMGTEVGAAARAGEMYVDNADAHDITFISLAPLDLQNNPTKPCHQGDIIELDWPDGGVARYEVDSGEQVALTVKYISGTHRFETGQELETYVYPQNKGSASKEYVESLVNQASPIGTIVFWGGNRVNIPTGWIECNEQKLPDNVAAILGTSYAPDLKNYMPAGIGGVFGDTRGKYAARHHKHRHMWGAPQDRKGWPSGSTDENGSSSSPSKAYWRGANTSTTSSYAEATSYSGDKDFACPPVQTGVYIMRIA